MGAGMEQRRVEIRHPRARSALSLGADLIETILSLPTIPSEDWCELSASALSRAVSLGTQVAIVESDASGVIVSLRGIGAARWPGADGARFLTRVRPEGRAGVAGRAYAWRCGNEGEIVLASGETSGIARASHVVVAVWDGAGLGVPGSVGAGGGRDEMCEVMSVAVERLASRASRAFAHVPEGVSVSASECKVLELLIEGLSIPEIGRRIARSPHTIHDHVKSLHRKLGATRRGELIMRAVGWPPTGARLAEPARSGGDDGAGAAAAGRAGIERGAAGAMGDHVT